MKILYNAKIYTLNPNQPHAAALVLNDLPPNQGRILAVDDSEQIRESYGHIASAEDLGGKVVLPGLTDAHIHLRQYANMLQSINLFGAGKHAVLELVAREAARTSPGDWIQGYGWSQDNWGGAFPTATELDAAAPGHPVLLMGVSLHVLWANSAALKAAGITAQTPDPPKGVIQRDPDGSPNGIILEEAMSLFNHLLPHPTAESTLALFELAQEQLWQMGITGVHNFDRIPSFITLQTLKQQRRLKLRVVQNLPVKSLDVIIASGLRTGLGDDLLRIGSIKAFADGALGSRTAAMMQPYLADPQNTGMLLLDAEDLIDFGEKAVQNGLSLTIHAIGDAANHQMLDGFDHLRRYEQAHCLPRYRHRIEHVQVMHQDDIPRLAALDLVASMQPIHATSDIEMADTGWGERARYAYAWRSLLDTGTRLSFGSDAPVDSPNPFHGLYAAITRRKPDGHPGTEGWYPQERIRLEEAFQAYTNGAAYTAGLEESLGMLAPGYLADLLVLDQDPFTLPPEELREVLPAATMLGGEWVYRK
ncbi:MAG: amidohydrolase [Anaerolineales bacterium]|jgi:predicted amidohydrolase YtcJ